MTAGVFPFLRRLRRLGRSRMQPGTLDMLPDIYSPELDATRDIYVYLPPGYADEVRRYPVVYMHDAQNLFGTGKGFSSSWRVEEAVTAATRLRHPCIVVGVPHAGVDRIVEYSPFDDPDFGAGRGDRHLDFLIDTLKPQIDKQYRTLRERRWTGIAGSSMGGLISLYAAFTRAEVFGFAGALSPSFWFAGAAIFPVVEMALATTPESERPRVYLDVGRYEGQRAVDDARRMRSLLIANGYLTGESLRWVEDPKGGHNEAAWARRFRKALPALLAA